MPSLTSGTRCAGDALVVVAEGAQPAGRGGVGDDVDQRRSRSGSPLELVGGQEAACPRRPPPCRRRGPARSGGRSSRAPGGTSWRGMQDDGAPPGRQDRRGQQLHGLLGELRRPAYAGRGRGCARSRRPVAAGLGVAAPLQRRPRWRPGLEAGADMGDDLLGGASRPWRGRSSTRGRRGSRPSAMVTPADRGHGALASSSMATVSSTGTAKGSSSTGVS